MARPKRFVFEEIKDHHSVDGGDKIARYSWKMRDKPGELCEINKRDLKIDPSYQRSLKRARVLDMAQDWSWVACGAVVVVLRQPGEWFVVDGQHRVAAALLRSDIERIPCIAYAAEDLRQEAQGFIDTNTKRGSMTLADRFKALIITKDHAALVANELIQAAGLNIALGGGGMTISCISAMLDGINANEHAFRCIWPIVVDLCKASGAKITQHLVRGTFYLETHLPQGVSLTEKRWKERFASTGHRAIDEGIQGAAVYYGSKGQRASAVGISNALNKGLKFKLPFKISEE